ncbi:hypothetical protein SMC26_29645 [Actinomadura fulvescens]|uniref:GNAT family N-acetyltransferase n=1 Tax=Actinomadura fulvescens TaxID=46160 RepID=A0ABN3QKE9_9ACTN
MPASSSPGPELPVDPVRKPSVEPVRTRSRLREFVELPYRLYEGDPHFVPPLRGECRRLLSRRHNPFFAYGDAELFTARRDGRVVGRIAAVHNPRHNEVHQARDGFFGQFECEDDPAVARALIDTASGWLRRRGLATMLGPFNFTTNDECGLLVDGFDTSPRVLMPYNPPYYPALLESCGLAKAKDLWTWERGTQPPGDRLLRLYERVQRREQVSVRTLDLRHFDRDLAKIRHVYHVAWRHNWGFVPMTDAELTAFARRLRRIVDPSLVLLVEAAGEPVAAGLAVPDVNQALSAARGRSTPIGLLRLSRAARAITQTRGLLLGVVPGYRERGLELLLYGRFLEAARTGGYRGTTEFGWTLEDNRPINQSMTALGCTHAKTYRIYGKDL